MLCVVQSETAVCVLCVVHCTTNKFKSGGLHEKHVVATWNVGNHLRICFWAQANQEAQGYKAMKDNKIVSLLLCKLM